MGHLQCWVFGLFLSRLATQYDPVEGIRRGKVCLHGPLVTASPTGPSGCTLADTQKGIQAALTR